MRPMSHTTSAMTATHHKMCRVKPAPNSSRVMIRNATSTPISPPLSFRLPLCCQTHLLPELLTHSAVLLTLGVRSGDWLLRVDRRVVPRDRGPVGPTGRGVVVGPPGPTQRP